MSGVEEGVEEKVEETPKEEVFELEEEPEEPIEQVPVSDEIEDSLEKAIEAYRKTMENQGNELTEDDLKKIDKTCEDIKNREIIEKIEEHVAEQIESDDGKVLMGPPTLTRFEKARIMGARALQLSLGAPPFIEIPKNAATSLEIAMEELKQRVIPIVIRRILPNGDFQNIPIEKFE